MKKYLLLFFALVLFISCIDLKSFLFDATPADSTVSDYHGLPLYSGDSPPDWIDENSVERNIFLSVPEGRMIAPEERADHTDYIHGAFLPAPNLPDSSDAPLKDKNITFFYTHGNSGTMYLYWYRAVALWNMGANVFIFSYRGYGLSKGEANAKNIKQDCNTALTYLKTRDDIDKNRIIVYGYSMGGISASYICGESQRHKNTCAGVILESALDAPEEIIDISTGIDFSNEFFIGSETYSGVEFIKGCRIPVLHFHGSEDQRVIIDQAYNYYSILKDRDNYTHYIGKTSKRHEDWIKESDHRNLPVHSFKAEEHLSTFYDHPENPNHCCVHPSEYTEPQYSEFLKQVGNTTGMDISKSSQDYEDLIGNWIKSNFY
ncbi:MAG: alpha/beta hydrolase family protein [Chitinivibrionales bacterium]